MRHLLRLPQGHPPTAVSGLAAELTRTPGDALRLNYLVTVPPAVLRLPAPASPESADELWKHTCFEAFIRASGDAYYEFNLSPSTRWAAYRFDGYRAGMASAPRAGAPRIEVRTTLAGLELSADLRLGGVPELARQDWQVGLSAVIEAADGTLSYWALAHPPGRPDFHHADCFALEVPAPQDA